MLINILLVISIILNIILVSVGIYYIKKPDLISAKIDEQHRKRVEDLKETYYKKERELSDALNERTKKVAEEITELRTKLERDIQQEVQKSREQKISELDKEFSFRIKALKEKEAQIESDLISNFEQFRIGIEFQQEEITRRLESLKSYEGAAVQARIRMYEEKNKEKFYMIDLDEQDIIEIEELEDILPHLRNPVPLKKAIFEIYFRNPVRDMINRVLGAESRVSGIYKITLIDTGECYIGQSVDMKSRWLQHIRRGFGLEELTQNKLYPAMIKYGLHHFKFELVELCEEDLLSEKEKYWAEYFGAQIFGFSVKN